MKRLVFFTILSICLISPAAASSGVLTGFESQSLSNFGGATSDYATTTSNSYNGTASLTKSGGGGAFSGIYNSSAPDLDLSQKVNISAWYYYDGNIERGGIGFLTSSDGGGYNLRTDPKNNQIALEEFSSQNSITGSLGGKPNAFYSSGNWYKLVLQKDGDTYKGWMLNSNGSVNAKTVSSTDATENPDTFGSISYDTGIILDTISCSGPGCNLDSSSGNSVPSLSNFNPSDGATDVSRTTDISVDYTDSDGDLGSVYIKWGNGTVIKHVTGVSSGSTVTADVGTLSYGTDYSYKVNASDGNDSVKSGYINFTTESGSQQTSIYADGFENSDLKAPPTEWWDNSTEYTNFSVTDGFSKEGSYSLNVTTYPNASGFFWITSRDLNGSKISDGDKFSAWFYNKGNQDLAFQFGSTTDHHGGTYADINFRYSGSGDIIAYNGNIFTMTDSPKYSEWNELEYTFWPSNNTFDARVYDSTGNVYGSAFGISVTSGDLNEFEYVKVEGGGTSPSNAAIGFVDLVDYGFKSTSRGLGIDLVSPSSSSERYVGYSEKADFAYNVSGVNLSSTSIYANFSGSWQREYSQSISGNFSYEQTSFRLDEGYYNYEIRAESENDSKVVGNNSIRVEPNFKVDSGQEWNSYTDSKDAILSVNTTREGYLEVDTAGEGTYSSQLVDYSQEVEANSIVLKGSRHWDNWTACDGCPTYPDDIVGNPQIAVRQNSSPKYHFLAVTQINGNNNQTVYNTSDLSSHTVWRQSVYDQWFDGNIFFPDKWLAFSNSPNSGYVDIAKSTTFPDFTTAKDNALANLSDAGAIRDRKTGKCYVLGEYKGSTYSSKKMGVYQTSDPDCESGYSYSHNIITTDDRKIGDPFIAKFDYRNSDGSDYYSVFSDYLKSGDSFFRDIVQYATTNLSEGKATPYAVNDPAIPYADGSTKRGDLFIILNETSGNFKGFYESNAGDPDTTGYAKSGGPWNEKVEARVGVDSNNDSSVDEWTGWQTVRPSYTMDDSNQKLFHVDPASLDLSGLSTGYAFRVELNLTRSSPSPRVSSFEMDVTNDTTDSTAPSLNLHSPTNTTYTSSQIDLNVTSTEAANYTYNYGSGNTTVNENNQDLNETLSLSDGSYDLTVWAEDTAGNIGSNSVSFTVDTTPPSITIHSPENKTYGTDTIDLNTTANQNLDTWIYNLDNAANQTFTPNTTLSGLSNDQHSVTVWANDSNGNYNQKTRYFTVSQNSPPTAGINLNTTSMHLDEFVEANGTCNDSDSTCSSIEYDWTSDGTYDATGSTAVNSYGSTGEYKITVKVTDNDGSTDTASKNVTVTANSAPTADADANTTTVEIGEFVEFQGYKSSDSDGSISSYEWDFTNDSSFEGSGVNVSHSYSSSGSKVGVLKVTDDDGESDMDNITVTVDGNDAPSASFTASTSDLQVDVDASQSSDVDGSITSYQWDWTNDGSYDATGQTQSHTYNSDGTYTIKLKITDNDGATNTATNTASVSQDSDSGGGSGGGGTTPSNDPPNITLYKPQNQDYENTGIPYKFEPDDPDGNLDKCWYNIDNSANQTISCSNAANTTGNFNVDKLGEHRFAVYANDTDGAYKYKYQDFKAYIENTVTAQDQIGNTINDFEVTIKNSTETFGGTTEDGTFEFNTSETPYGSNVNLTIRAKGYQEKTVQLPEVNDSFDYSQNVKMDQAEITLEAYNIKNLEKIRYNATFSNSTNTEQILSSYSKDTNIQYNDNDQGHETINLNNFTASNQIKFKVKSNTYAVSDFIKNETVHYVDGSNDTFDLYIQDNLDTVITKSIDKGIPVKIEWDYSLTDCQGCTINQEINKVTVNSSKPVTVKVNYQLWKKYFPVNDISASFDVENYQNRQYLETWKGYKNTEISAYLLKTAEGQYYPGVKIVDSKGEAVPDAKIQVQRQVQGTYTSVAERYSTDDGTASFFLEPGARYRVKVSKKGYTTKTVSYDPSATPFGTREITIKSTDDFNLNSQHFEYKRTTDAECSKYTDTSIKCIFNTTNKEYSKTQVKIDKNKLFGSQNVCWKNTTKNTDSLYCNNLNLSSSEYTATVTSYFQEYPVITEKEVFGDTSTDTGAAGLMMSFLLFIVLTGAGSWRPSAAIILATVSVILSAFTGLLAITQTGLISLIALAAIMLWRIKN